MGRQILVADSDEATILALGESLTRAGLEPAFARSRADALIAFDERRPALVVIGVELGGGDGVELCAEIRSREDGAFVPIIMLGDGRPGAAVRSYTDAITINADDFFRRPVDPERLHARILAFTGFSKPSSSVQSAAPPPEAKATTAVEAQADAEASQGSEVPESELDEVEAEEIPATQEEILLNTLRRAVDAGEIDPEWVRKAAAKAKKLTQARRSEAAETKAAPDATPRKPTLTPIDWNRLRGATHARQAEAKALREAEALRDEGRFSDVTGIEATGEDEGEALRFSEVTGISLPGDGPGSSGPEAPALLALANRETVPPEPIASRPETGDLVVADLETPGPEISAPEPEVESAQVDPMPPEAAEAVEAPEAAEAAEAAKRPSDAPWGTPSGLTMGAENGAAPVELSRASYTPLARPPERDQPEAKASSEPPEPSVAAPEPGETAWDSVEAPEVTRQSAGAQIAREAVASHVPPPRAEPTPMAAALVEAARSGPSEVPPVPTGRGTLPGDLLPKAFRKQSPSPGTILKADRGVGSDQVSVADRVEAEIDKRLAEVEQAARAAVESAIEASLSKIESRLSRASSIPATNSTLPPPPLASETPGPAPAPETMRGRTTGVFDSVDLIQRLRTLDATGVLRLESGPVLVWSDGAAVSVRGTNATIALLDDLSERAFLSAQVSSNARRDLGADRPELVVQRLVDSGAVDEKAAWAAFDRVLNRTLGTVVNHVGDWVFEKVELDAQSLDAPRRDVRTRLVSLVPRSVPLSRLITVLGGEEVRVRLVQWPHGLARPEHRAFLERLDGKATFAYAQQNSGLPTEEGASLAVLLLAFGYAVREGFAPAQGRARETSWRSVVMDEDEALQTHPTADLSPMPPEPPKASPPQPEPPPPPPLPPQTWPQHSAWPQTGWPAPYPVPTWPAYSALPYPMPPPMPPPGYAPAYPPPPGYAPPGYAPPPAYPSPPPQAYAPQYSPYAAPYPSGAPAPIPPNLPPLPQSPAPAPSAADSVRPPAVEAPASGPNLAAALEALDRRARSGDYFEMLGVSRNASLDEIRAAHARLTAPLQGRQLRDNPELEPLARRVCDAFDEALAVLRIPELRDAYRRNLTL